MITRVLWLIACFISPLAGILPAKTADGRSKAMMWVIERPDGGRGMGFTGGQFHDNWGDDNFRKIVLNALVWVESEVPATGVLLRIMKHDLDANLDPKPVRKK